MEERRVFIGEHLKVRRKESEGGCGVIGLASSDPVAGRNIIRPLEQMHNRGNGKGGGIAAAGCFPGFKDHYALHIGYMDRKVVEKVEEEFITPNFDISDRFDLPSVDDFQDIPGIAIEPPAVTRYFCRVRRGVLSKFSSESGIEDPDRAEDEFVYRNSWNLNNKWYAETEEKKAFVLSHGKNLMVLKGVGYAESIAKFYLMDDFEANIWIGHQRYPTRGRVWHPGGAHPFIGLNSALVHNGDLANYHSICEYLQQRGRLTQFQTDTEVAAHLFDYYTRVLGYPLEYTIEALAPTTEMDFDMLPRSKQRLYKAIGAAHIHGSPDGPWFFIILRNDAASGKLQLIGITDTSMLRPQVFALSRGSLDIGVVASEKQAIDALLEELSLDTKDDDSTPRCPVADLSWVSRGGSHTDGGAFIFTLESSGNGTANGNANGNMDGNSNKHRNGKNGLLKLECTDKFGRPVIVPGAQKELESHAEMSQGSLPGEKEVAKKVSESIEGNGAFEAFEEISTGFKEINYNETSYAFKEIAGIAGEGAGELSKCSEVLTLLLDRRYHTGDKKRKWITAMAGKALLQVFAKAPGSREQDHRMPDFVRFEHGTAKDLSQYSGEGDDLEKKSLFLDAAGFDIEGPASVASFIVRAFRIGFRKFIIFNLAGHRFLGCGLGPSTTDTKIDLYGSSGDYTASGIDGAEVHIHGDAQDQVGQIMKSGRIVIHGNVGQTFLYGAKGGSAFVSGNTGGRPLINAVGNIRAVINGSCLDYAAESFMAGEGLGGGFVLINGLRINIYGEVIGLKNRLPGGNFFSLASGGAGYLNDPYHSVTPNQLNGAKFVPFKQEDWNIISKYLQLNENYFGISINGDILTVDRIRKWPQEVFRKVVAVKNG